jgi:predicted oxidoreductase
MMSRLHLSPNGPEVSRFAYGTWRLMDDVDGHAPARVAGKIAACLELGITTFDLAEIYGSYLCEDVFGAGLAKHPGLRQRIEIITKCGIAGLSPQRSHNRIAHYDVSESAIVAAAEQSLRYLHTDHLDALLVHRPSPMMDPDETAAALSKLRAAGKIRHAGVSNFTPAQFDLLQSRLDFPLVTNQIEISLLQPTALLDGAVEHLMQHRVTPMAWSPTAGGQLFTSNEERATRIRAALESLAPKYGCSAETLAYAWLLAHPSRMQVVLGTNKIERVRSAVEALKINLDLQDWFILLKASTGTDVP